MDAVATIARNPVRAIASRTRGHRQGPITRLMSPSDFGEILKPFVFLDLFDFTAASFGGMGLHPHSGIATLTYVAEGSVSYEDTNRATGLLRAGGIEWMQAGGGIWHGGGPGEPGRTRGFQLWVALPPELELGPSSSRYLAAVGIGHDGPASVLLGSYGAAASPIVTPSPINYLAVKLKRGERWQYHPPRGHTVLWVAVSAGAIAAPEEIATGELAAFEPSPGPVEIVALSDAELVLGSAVPHGHDLVLGHYSVHTTTEALRQGEARIASIRSRLVEDGKL